jgi:hypothetical protein
MSIANDLCLTGLFILPTKTHDEWIAYDPVIPLGVIIYVSDHKHIKVGDGITFYSQLPYIGVDPQLTSAYLDFLVKYNKANGAVILNNNKLIDEQFLPVNLRDNIRIKEYPTYTTLLAELQPTGLAIVINATDDPRVDNPISVLYYYRKVNKSWIILSLGS